MASQAVKIVDGGKLIIPAAFRRKLGIDTGDTVVIELARLIHEGGGFGVASVA